MLFDVVVVGGGAAGLNAALVLGRARRRTLVVDSGKPRNAPASHAHGFLSRDGIAPAELLQIGRAQLQPYTSVQFRPGEVVDAERGDGGFTLALADGATVRTHRLLLTTGVIDELPDIDGMRGLWGTGVFHCPYCHGWEVREQPLAVYGRGQSGLELTALLLGWSRNLVLCTDGPAELSLAERQRLARHAVALHEERIVRLEGRDGRLEAIVFADGSRLRRTGLFLRPPQRQHSELPAMLGCTFDSAGLVQTDENGQTSVPGVYAAGDAARRKQQVIIAAADGARAAIAINNSLAMEDFGDAYGN